MLEPIGHIDIFDEGIDQNQKLNEVIVRVNLLTEYITLEMTQTLAEDAYTRIKELRKTLGIKLP